MKCPKCKEEIEQVFVYSECRQIGWLKENTNKIDKYDSVDEILNTTGIECRECGEDIRKYIIEE